VKDRGRVIGTWTPAPKESKESISPNALAPISKRSFRLPSRNRSKRERKGDLRRSEFPLFAQSRGA
jgi:hypothetical protein